VRLKKGSLDLALWEAPSSLEVSSSFLLGIDEAMKRATAVTTII
jgi:hypothetical protein